MSGSEKPEMNMALYKDQVDADKAYIERECRKTLVVYGKEYVDPARCDAAKLYVKEKESYRSENNREAWETLEEMKKTLNDRKEKKVWKDIYPLNNYDFNYAQVIKNELNPYTLGITNTIVMPRVVDNIGELRHYNDALLEKPFPSENTVAGTSDVTTDKQYQNEIVKIKGEYNNLPLPYNDFLKDYPEEKYPTRGLNSTSYFIKTSGFCPSKITTKEECEKAGLNWVESNPGIPPEYNEVLDKLTSGVSELTGGITSKIKEYVPSVVSDQISGVIQNVGSAVVSDIKEAKEKASTSELKSAGVEDPNKMTGVCLKPKFAYINNEAKGILQFRGLAPSSVKDIMSLSPDKLMSILSGQTVEGTGIIPCAEGFEVRGNKRGIIVGIMIITIIMIIIMICK